MKYSILKDYDVLTADQMYALFYNTDLDNRLVFGLSTNNKISIIDNPTRDSGETIVSQHSLTVDKAIQDGNGNIISSSYLKINPSSAYDVNTQYDAGVYLVSEGLNAPSSAQYGTLLTLPNKKSVENTNQGFAAQLFIPKGNDQTYPNALFYRTSTENSWNSWNRVLTTNDSIDASTARTLSPCAWIGSDDDKTSGWYKVASSTMSGYEVSNLLFYVKSGYYKNYFGIFSLEMRTNNGNIECYGLRWLVRSGFSVDHLRIVISGMTWTLYCYNPSGRYGRVYFTALSHCNINGGSPKFPIGYHNSTTPEASAPSNAILAVDGGTVNFANSSTKATQDASGNTITTTYRKISDSYTKTECDAKYVTMTADQTVSGVKTFSNGLKVSTTEASSGSCKLQYDNTQKCMKFVFE